MIGPPASIVTGAKNTRQRGGLAGGSTGRDALLGGAGFLAGFQGGNVEADGAAAGGGLMRALFGEGADKIVGTGERLEAVAALHRGEVARSQGGEAGDLAQRIGRGLRQTSGAEMAGEQLSRLLGAQRQETQLHIKAAQRRGIQFFYQIGRSEESAGKSCGLLV